MTGVRESRGNLGQRAQRNFLPLGSRLEGEINLHSSTISKEEEGPQGPLPPRAVATAVAVSVVVVAGAAISFGLHLSINNSLSLSPCPCVSSSPSWLGLVP